MNIGIIASQNKGTAPVEPPFIPPTLQIPLNVDGGWYYPLQGNGEPHPYIAAIEPGTIIEVTSDIAVCKLDGLQGTAERPIIIRNVGGPWRFNGRSAGYCFNSTGVNHVIIDGSGQVGLERGLIFGEEETEDYSPQPLTIVGSNWTVRYCEITHGEVGLMSRPSTGPNQHNVHIHHNWIHDMRHPGTTCEGMYLGATNIGTITGTHFENIHIHDNLLENLGGDGIQCACAQNYHIHDNIVQDFGLGEFPAHQIGIIIGGHSYGTVEDNLIQRGTGSGMQVFGYSLNIVQNNQILNTSTSPNQDGIYIRKNLTSDGDPLQVNIFNNVISNAGGPAITRYGIFNATENGSASIPGTWSGNTITNVTAGNYASNIGDNIIP